MSLHQERASGPYQVLEEEFGDCSVSAWMKFRFWMFDDVKARSSGLGGERRDEDGQDVREPSAGLQERNGAEETRRPYNEFGKGKLKQNVEADAEGAGVPASNGGPQVVVCSKH